MLGIHDGGSPACSDPAPADVCAQLNPPLGAPVVHREREIVSDVGPGQSCGSGAYPSSGTGVVLHPMESHFFYPPRFDFIDATGAQVGMDRSFSIATFAFQVVPQSHGFAIWDGYEGGMGSYGVILDDDRGSGRGYGPPGYAVVPLAGGSVAVLSFSLFPDCGQKSQMLLQRIPDDGSGPAGTPLLLGCYAERPTVLLAANGSGSVLVVFSNDGAGGPDALWMDDDFHVVQRFTNPELSSVEAVAPLIDGSFVLRVQGRWTYRIPAGSTSLEAAPCWLTQRPGTDLEMVRGRSAYVLRPVAAGGCDGAIEVFTPEGQSCGTVGPLGDANEGRCDLAIGRDGTVSRSAEALDAGAGQPRECALRFWPAALGPTGP
ncbi:MAG TPA: hypothetical protein VFI53_13670 [Myxococcaceae bacterium]|nr:hypothetical protein [Myxococcaceae bacterium]